LLYIWESLKIFYPTLIPDFTPGAVIAIQTFGDLLGFNPHGHALVPDGCFYSLSIFRLIPTVKLKYLEEIFRKKVFKMLLAKGKITPDQISLLTSWRHS